MYGPVIGADRTSAAAERWAAYIAVMAVAAVQEVRSVTLLIDNISVGDQVHKLANDGWVKPAFAVSMWRNMFKAMHGKIYEVHWVPSHGKHKKWRPRHDQASNREELRELARAWRGANEHADRGATLALAPLER